MLKKSYVCINNYLLFTKLFYFMRNHLKHFILFAVLMVLSTAAALAQATLKGKIVDAETHEPLIGATVSIKGSTLGSITDVEGCFELSLKSSKNVIVFSYVGYNELEKTIKADAGIVDLGEIMLSSSAIGLVFVYHS